MLKLLYPYTTEKKLRKHERICNDRDFRHLKMYVSGEKSLKVPFIIYADLECLLRKINICSSNPEKSYTE